MFPTTPGSPITYRGTTFWVLRINGRRVTAEAADGTLKTFYNNHSR